MRVREAHSARRKTVEVRRRNRRLALGIERHVVEVIDDDEEDVRPFGVCETRPRENEQHDERVTKKCSGEGHVESFVVEE